MIKLTSFFTAMLIFFGNFYAWFLPKAPEAPTAEELSAISSSIQKKELGDVVYAVDISSFTEDEKYSAIALQGIVAKTNPCIYFTSYDSYINEIEKSGKTVIRTDSNGKKWTYKSLVSQFSSYIGDRGYVLYENSEFAEGMNVASNFATAYSWLPVPVSVRDSAEECGLTLKKDLTTEKYDYAFQRKYFNQLKKYFNKGTVVHLSYRMTGMRDLAVSQGYFCFYTQNDTAGDIFLREVLSWSGKNTAVYGWCEQEKHMVELLSEMGCTITPSDFCRNTSYLSQLETGTAFRSTPGTAYTDDTRHYVTLVFSDGDNCQWLQNGFPEYHSVMRDYPDCKITWTFSPFIKSLCPFTLERTVAAANENASFIAGPSGLGYCNPSLFDGKSLDVFSAQTANAMLQSGQRIVTILDDYSAIHEGTMKWSFDYFSRFDNIDGGILFFDPDRYEGGKGKVWFSNDKPFASVRLSLWADGGYDGATDEWIQKQADTVNSYPADIHSVNGYSVICVHAWTMKPASVEKFISLLSDRVQILSAADFLATISQNVPHETSIPD